MDTNFLGMVNSILNGDQSPSQRAKNLLAVSSSENLFNQKVALLVEDLCKEAVLPIYFNEMKRDSSMHKTTL